VGIINFNTGGEEAGTNGRHGNYWGELVRMLVSTPPKSDSLQEGLSEVSGERHGGRVPSKLATKRSRCGPLGRTDLRGNRPQLGVFGTYWAAKKALIYLSLGMYERRKLEQVKFLLTFRGDVW